ncbi:cell wall-associated NlpC family hydrolase [Kitasatospora sp. GAS204A]|uniref:transglycosylase family protein n=1 Tax=unclassified Kitasatospora TaxID=2633591 RepID=UPI0024730127|nr:transglycosylase family protein [Kitasatospora sp. GAS204B]MDH6120331.1 cell wall-associated NlpC family hydrolase [Kitasatospora sp. GAS204B]
MLPTSGTTRPSRNARRVIAATGLLGLGLTLPCITATTANAAPVSTWDKVAQCESSGDWSINTGNGYYGGLQFSASTWAAYGGTQYAAQANQATKDQQIAVAEKVLADQGPGAWPVCSIQAGLTAGGPAPAINPGGSTSSSAATTSAPAPSTPAPSAPAQSSGSHQGGSDHGNWGHWNHSQGDQSYTVKAGDWLSTIANTHHVDGGWQKLYDLNKSVLTQGPDLLYPGEHLSLGTQAAPATQAPASTPAPAPAPAVTAQTTAATSAPAATGSMAAAISFAESQVGQAYIYGGTGNGGWDCSGLTQAAMAKAGISIPRVAADQAAASTPVSMNSLQPGDLLFWSNNGQDSGVYHVAIYVGNGQFVEAANPSAGVKYETISNYAPDFAGRV